MNTVLTYNLLALSLIANIIIGLYAVVAKPNLIKKIIGLTIVNDTVCVLLVLMGYRGIRSQPPIYIIDGTFSPPPHTVDPLPQAFVLTAIVIGFSFTVFLSVIALRIYELYGSLNLHRLLVSEVVEEVEPDIEPLEE